MNIDDTLTKMNGYFSVEVIERSTGKVVDSYEEKNVIVLDSRTAITRAIAGDSSGVINAFKIGTDVGAGVSISGTPSLTFADANPDTITRSGGSWIDDGFLSEMTVTISGTSLNDGVYTIDTLTDLTLTLVLTDSLVAETPPAGSVSVTGVASPNNPEPAKDVFDETTMTLLYEYPTPPSVGYPNTTSVNFNMTLVGEAVMAYYPTESFVTFTSAALHSTDGNVFAYKRFPQKSISPLLDINVVWNIGY